MLENSDIFVNPKKRVKNFSTLNLEEVAVLKSSEDAEYIAKEFDRIFLKLQRLISYSTRKNNAIKSDIEEDTNNLLKKFLNYIKGKALPRKIKDEQHAFFYDICKFINFFDGDSYFTKIHNSIPKTSIREYNEKTVSEQFFQMNYGRERGLNGMPEGGDCSYWTILHYNFFNKLKEAGLDIDIKLFRYKNLDDRIVGAPSMRHSGLVITFQGEDYFVDHEGILLGGNDEPIARKVQPYIDAARDVEKDEKIAVFFENFKHENMKETDQVIFFDDVNDFITHVEKNPNYQKIAYLMGRGENERPDQINYEFANNAIGIAVNGHRHMYYPKDNNFNKNNFPEDFIDKLEYEKDINGIHPITKESKETFKRFFAVISDKINSDWLYQKFKSNGKWKNVMIDDGGIVGVFMLQEK